MIPSLAAPMSDYISSIFLPTFHVYEWEPSRLTSWLKSHSQSLTTDDIAARTEYDFIHIPRDPSYDYRRVHLSIPYVRPYGWILLTMPLTSSIWYKIEQHLANWTCIYAIPMYTNLNDGAVLLRKPNKLEVL